MTTAQIWKYRAAWGAAWKALRASGQFTGQKADDVRKRWHVFIGAVYLRGPDAGQPKSSSVLTNAEFDRFLKRCAAAEKPDSLAAQLALDDQPLIRLRHATDPLLDLVKMDEASREAYLAGIYSNVQRKRVRVDGLRELAVHEMPDADLQLVLVALTHTVMHKLGAKHDHPTVGKGPQARFDHQVGAKKDQTLAGQPPRDAVPAEFTVPGGVEF